MFKRDSSKEKAISVFKKHQSKLNKGDIYQWLRYSADLTDKYIGPDTQLKTAWRNMIQFETSNLTQKANSLIEQCIESIEDNGVYKEPNNNFLMTLTNGELATLISTVLIASIGGAWLLGTSYNQFRIDKLNEENYRLESSLKKAEGALSVAKEELNRSVLSNRLSNRPAASDTGSVVSKPMTATAKQ